MQQREQARTETREIQAEGERAGLLQISKQSRTPCRIIQQEESLADVMDWDSLLQRSTGSHA